MNLLNKLFKAKQIKKGDELKKRLKECVGHENATCPRDHVNPEEYFDLLIKYKANQDRYKVYSTEMDALDKAMCEVKQADIVKRLRSMLK